MLKIYGSSDDLVELVGVANKVKTCPRCGHDIDEPVECSVGDGDDEVDTGGKNLAIIVGDMEHGGVVVRMRYEHSVTSGCWSAELAQMGEGVPIPWPVLVATTLSAGADEGSPYSVMVKVDAPHGTPVRWEKPS